MAAAAADTSITCAALELALSGPPAKKFLPRSTGPGSSSFTSAPSGFASPYWATVKLPVVIQPGTISTLSPEGEPGPSSAAPLRIKLVAKMASAPILRTDSVLTGGFWEAEPDSALAGSFWETEPWHAASGLAKQ